MWLHARRLMEFNGTAGCGIRPEVERPAPDQQRPQSPPQQPLSSSSSSSSSSSFCSAFRSEPAFCALYICGVIFWFSQAFVTPFWFFFLQDAFPSGYVIAGWRLTRSTQTLVCVLNLVGQALTATFASCGGRLRERWGGRQTIAYTTLLGQATNFTYAFFPDQFWLVAAWTLWNSSMNGLAAAANFALSMDCLPVGPDGRPSNAARDRAIQATHRAIPNSFMPALVGFWIAGFPTAALGYRWSFGVGNAINLLSTAVFYLALHPLEEPLDKPCQCTRGCLASRRAHDARRRAKVAAAAAAVGVVGSAPTVAVVPLGAELCDWLLFGAAPEAGSGATRTVRVRGSSGGGASERQHPLLGPKQRRNIQ